MICAASSLAVETIQIKMNISHRLLSSLQYNSEYTNNNFSLSYVRVYCVQIIIQLRCISHECVSFFVPYEGIIVVYFKIRSFL